MRKKQKPSKKVYWRANNNIGAAELRVIGKDGKQLGVLKLSDARALAHKAGIDLVEIAPNAKPPVAKIVDFGKFKYQEEKKRKKQEKESFDN